MEEMISPVLFYSGYMENSGVVKTTDLQRYNMRLNADVKCGKIQN